MKLSSIVLGSLLSISAFAAEVKIMTIDNSANFQSNITSEYKLNKDLGRAWVETTIDNRTSSDDSIGQDTYRGKAAELSFDQNTSEVVLDVEGARVVCATVRTAGRSIFRHDVIRSTGNCSFVHKKVKLVIDNGYETYTKNQTEVSIVTK